MRKRIFFFLVASLFAAALLLVLVIFAYGSQGFKVVFLDVGQGDAILLMDGSQQVLIDGGRDGKLLLEKLARQMPFWDRELETVIVTHPDQDHFGGLLALLRNYKVHTIIESGVVSESKTFATWQEMEKAEGAQLLEAQTGQKIKFPGGNVLEILAPGPDAGEFQGETSNGASIISKLTSGGWKFLFMGDLPLVNEEKLLASGIDLDAQVLKVSHHGSKNATGEKLLETVRPLEAIISVGGNNQYGHPTVETLQRLRRHDVNILRTDEQGDIAYVCFSDRGCQRE